MVPDRYLPDCEFIADIGIALNWGAIDTALSNEDKALHSGRHLIEARIVRAETNAVKLTAFRAIASAILSRPIALFIRTIGTGAGEVGARLYVGAVGRNLIGVAIAEGAAGGYQAGDIVSILIIKQ